MLGRPFPEEVLLVLLMTFGADDRDGWMGRLVEVNTMDSNGVILLMVLISCGILMRCIGSPLASFTLSLVVLLGLPKISSR